jgi:hydrogenase maturation protein HypF
MMCRQQLRVTGRVQGVGFRPFIVRLAGRLGLTGRVVNGPGAVEIEIQGPAPSLAAFRAALGSEAPKAARILDVHARELPPQDEHGFRVEAGGTAGGMPALAPDLATCPRCLEEVRDPAARRYRYPFTACTDCGPRWSISNALPWARANTTLDAFPLCPACLAEYRDPADRRFHAEAMACPACGPRLLARGPGGEPLAEGDAALALAVAALGDGAILALKGLGGFQLLVDAASEASVARLRARKGRPEKPLAVMVPEPAWLDRLAVLNPRERALLLSPEAPIVLVNRREDARVAPAVAPGVPRLGLFLPTTALHHLLLGELGRPVVCTSGNRSGEPLCVAGAEAVARLGGIADLFLDHDRPIARPVDDAVFQVAAGRPQCLRLGRGCAPLVLDLPGDGAVLGLGGHLKAAPALALPGGVVAGAHVGDLEGPAALERLRAEALALARVTGSDAGVTACDRHPDYASTHAAGTLGSPVIPVQHHHAHAVACLVEHGLTAPALALTWDGIGLGDDGSLWGGEFLRLDAAGRYERLGGLRPFPLPGGEAAVREPRRALLGLLHAHGAGDAGRLAEGPARGLFGEGEWRTLCAALSRGVNAPPTSSAGRLFDAVAALTGLRSAAGYEGQAAAAVQFAAEAAVGMARTDGEIRLETGCAPWIADWGPLVDALLAASARGIPPGEMALSLHHALADLALAVARRAGLETVLLTGGCFQNRLLLELCVARLAGAGFTPLWPQRLPPNDGGLAVGQVAVARWLSEQGHQESTGFRRHEIHDAPGNA